MAGRCGRFTDSQRAPPTLAPLTPPGGCGSPSVPGLRFLEPLCCPHLCGPRGHTCPVAGSPLLRGAWGLTEGHGGEHTPGGGVQACWSVRPSPVCTKNGPACVAALRSRQQLHSRCPWGASLRLGCPSRVGFPGGRPAGPCTCSPHRAGGRPSVRHHLPAAPGLPSPHLCICRNTGPRAPGPLSPARRSQSRSVGP